VRSEGVGGVTTTRHDRLGEREDGEPLPWVPPVQLPPPDAELTAAVTEASRWARRVRCSACGGRATVDAGRVRVEHGPGCDRRPAEDVPDQYPDAVLDLDEDGGESGVSALDRLRPPRYQPPDAERPVPAV
jgi:hypothetical protein